jgi:hypothetical protein
MAESCKTIHIQMPARLEMIPARDRALSHPVLKFFMPELPLRPRHFPFCRARLPTANSMHAMQAPEELYSAPGTVSTALKALILQRPEERAPELPQLGCMHSASPWRLGTWAGDGMRSLPDTYKRINLPKAKPCRASRFFRASSRLRRATRACSRVNSSARIPSRLPIASTIAQC